ncbi:GPW/gp25 family protein [Acinetobacter sp. 102]|uniref:GPW/gp25 family protein n=1 Tax=Acinetobacter sp. 102 TaxID=3098766 RepID=UPI00300A18CF
MMTRKTGQAFSSELDHIKQSIQDILTTPIGSRIMRREYGSRLADLMDKPINDALILQCYSAIYTALLLWEKRIDVSQISIISPISHTLSFDMDFTLVDNNKRASLSISLSIGSTL